MNWWEWVFSGIGVLILGLFLEWLRKRSRPSSQRATLTAQGAKVSDSPVASGSGIIQNVNSPTTVLHVHAERTEPARPKLTIEIRQVCFGGTEDFVGKDLSDFRVERYIFVYVWMVNTESVATSVKQLSLSYSNAGETVDAVPVSDLSKWLQNVKWQESASGFQTHVRKEARNVLTPLPSQPLQQGVPSEGWVCFKASGVIGLGGDDGRIELCVEDSFSKEYLVESSAPFACEGAMVDHLDVWRRL